MKVVAWFCASALISAALHACFYGDCDCPPPPERPEPQVELPVRWIASWTAQGEQVEPPIAVHAATLTVDASHVVISYEREGTLHEIVYTIVGSL